MIESNRSMIKKIIILKWIFSLTFFNMDILVTIYIIDVKVSVYILKILLERSVSQNSLFRS